MKIKSEVVYDANFSINEHRGMGKYINNLVHVLKHNEKLSVKGLLKGKMIEDASCYYSFGFKNYILWEQFSMFFLSLKYKGTIIFPYNTSTIFLKKSVLNVLILHDLIYMNDYEIKSFKQKVGALYRRFVVPRIINKFRHIITVSEYSKREIINRFNIAPDNITVISNCIRFNTLNIIDNPSLSERENYILHIGGEPEYKNSKSLLFAFNRLPEDLKKKYKVKMIGIRNVKILQEYKEIARTLNIDSSIEFLQYQKDEDIVNLYKNAKMFVFPSFYEGFGIPIIESFKFGCPLLCSNSSCFPEIAGNAAIYFEPNEPSSITKAIIEVISFEERTHEKVLKGYEQLEKYSFNVFEDKVNSWYKKFLEKNRYE